MKQEGASNNDFSSQEAEPVVTILATGLSNVFEAALKDEGDNDTNTEHSTDYSQVRISLLDSMALGCPKTVYLPRSYSHVALQIL